MQNVVFVMILFYHQLHRLPFGYSVAALMVGFSKTVQDVAMRKGYFIECLKCGNVKKFKSKILTNGIYIPSRHAFWQNRSLQTSFEELSESTMQCGAERCLWPVSAVRLLSAVSGSNNSWKTAWKSIHSPPWYIENAEPSKPPSVQSYDKPSSEHLAANENTALRPSIVPLAISLYFAANENAAYHQYTIKSRCY